MTWTLDKEESSKPDMQHRRATNSPPVPALLNKVHNYLFIDYGQLKLKVLLRHYCTENIKHQKWIFLLIKISLTIQLSLKFSAIVLFCKHNNTSQIKIISFKSKILFQKNGSHQQNDRFSPILMHRVPCPPSPPVPAVLRQLQEKTLPPLISSDGETSSYARSDSPVIMQLPTEREEETTKLALPDIKPNLMSIPTESSDLLSQLTSIRKVY